MIRVLVIPSAALCLLVAGSSRAQDLSFRDALDQARRLNPLLSEARARVEEAQGQQRQARLKPNPRMTLQTEDIRPGTAQQPFSYANSTEDYFLLAQVIEVGGKRARRMDVAGAGEQMTEYQRQLVGRQVAANVSSAYWSAASAARIRDLTEQNLRTYQDDVVYSQNRVREGVMAEADLLRVEIERDRVKAALLAATRDADQATIALWRAIGRTDFPTAHLTGSLESVQAVAPPEVARVLEIRPELLVARERVRQAESDVRLEKANAKPDPEAFVGYKRNVGYDTAYAAVQVDLPVRNRNQGNIASAEARLHMAEAGLRATEATVRADVEAAQRAYRDQRSLLDLLPGTLARAEESERLARAAYREGGLDLLKLLDAERSRIQAQVEYNRALVDLRQSIVNLELASGEDPTGGEAL